MIDLFSREKHAGKDGTEFTVRRLHSEEIPAALALTWEVFQRFEAPEYTQEGIDFFQASLHDTQRIRAMRFYGAFDGDELVGTLCMRQPQHISGFFVRAAYHRRGIGRALFQTMRQDYDRQAFTVNSSPYAVEVYRRLGFVPTDAEQTVSGLRFTPYALCREWINGAVMAGFDAGIKHFLDVVSVFRYNGGNKEGGYSMEYFAMIGLLFAPVVCLLCTGWFFVRWKNEHENEAKAQKSRKVCRGFLIATVASLVVFGGLHLMFPITL